MTSRIASCAFGSQLFKPIEKNLFPNPDIGKKMAGLMGQEAIKPLGYSIVVDSQGRESFDITRLKGGESERFVTISRFVRGVLADPEKVKESVEGRSFDERVCLYLNLQKIASYIEKHNEKVDASFSFICEVVHVLLLILTFGLFSYKEQFHIKEFAVTLKELGVAKELPLGDKFLSLSFLHLVSMSEEERQLVLERVDFLDEWNAFAKGHPDLIGRLSSLPEKALAQLSLRELIAEADLAKSPIGLLYETEEALKQIVVSNNASPARVAFLAELLGKLSPIESNLHLKGEVKEWKKLPFDQLLRMEKEQFASYCASFREGAPTFVPSFPWPVRQHVLEISAEISRNKLEQFLDEITSIEGFYTQSSLIRGFSPELQRKLPPEVQGMLPVSFLQGLNWKKMEEKELAARLEEGLPRAFFVGLSSEDVQWFLECLPGKHIEWKNLADTPISAEQAHQIIQKLGVDWFFARTEAVLRMSAYAKLFVEGRSLSVQQLALIAKNFQLLNIFAPLLSEEQWKQFPAREVNVTDTYYAANYLPHFPKEKLSEIVRFANGKLDGRGFLDFCRELPVAKMCEFKEGELVLPWLIEERVKGGRAAQQFLKQYPKLSEKELRSELQNKGIKKDIYQPVSQSQYKGFWEVLLPKLREYGFSNLDSKSPFFDLRPEYGW